MVILGIDPGTAIVGWGVIEKSGNRYKTIDFGCITTSPKEEDWHRLATIYDGIEEIIKPIGFELPMDFSGNLLKNPIRPETATSKDCVILYEEKTNIIEAKEDYLNEWLDG